MRSKRPSRMSDLLLLSTTLVLPTEMKRMKLLSSRITRTKLFSYSRDSFVDVLSRIACLKAKRRDLIWSLNWDSLKNGETTLSSLRNVIWFTNTRSVSLMESQRLSSHLSSPELWTIFQRSSSAWSRNAVLLPWLSWLKMRDASVRLKNLVAVKPSRSSAREKMSCTRSWWVSIRVLLILTCRTLS